MSPLASCRASCLASSIASELFKSQAGRVLYSAMGNLRACCARPPSNPSALRLVGVERARGWGA